MLRLRILLVSATLSLALPAQAAVVSAAGGLQGAAVFAANTAGIEHSAALGSLAAVTPVKPMLPPAPVQQEDDLKTYAMIALGLIGLTVIRRKRYARH
jgi:hypothetical protein